jgi:hypothetical protein
LGGTEKRRERKRAGENKLKTELVLFSFMGCYLVPYSEDIYGFEIEC